MSTSAKNATAQDSGESFKSPWHDTKHGDSKKKVETAWQEQLALVTAFAEEEEKPDKSQEGALGRGSLQEGVPK
jgi:hypothetical protein